MVKSRQFVRMIGNVLPGPVKKACIWLINRPSRIHAWLFTAASHGTLPCPDKLFLHWMYWVFTGQKLNLKNPVTFQDKLNWLKLYNRNPLYTKLVDKYAVREWVAEKIGEEYLVPLYGVYDTFDDIDFSKLPDKFVLKCTHDSGSVCIVKDKSKMDLEAIRQKLEKGLATKQFYLSREWPYKNVKPRIICEEMLEDTVINDIIDYKFHCFNGTPKIVGVFTGRQTHEGTKCNYYDMEWKWQDIQDCSGYPNTSLNKKPVKFTLMIDFAKKLSKGIPCVRVDFYEVNGHLYFGEMTFFDSGGRMLFHPLSVNTLLGSWIKLPPKFIS